MLSNHVKPHIGNLRTKADADYLNTCRRKRNTVEHDYSGGATDRDANELIEFTREFLEDVTRWLRSSHPALM